LADAHLSNIAIRLSSRNLSISSGVIPSAILTKPAQYFKPALEAVSNSVRVGGSFTILFFRKAFSMVFFMFSWDSFILS